MVNENHEKLFLKRYSAEGSQSGEVEVSSDVFGVEPNKHVLHQAVRRQHANGRAGTAHTKTRGEVRGGGKKPWKQKGTGKARAGSTRSPIWVGGGVTFGPRAPRSFVFSLPKKVRTLAIRSSLSAAVSKFKIVEDFSFLTAPKTKLYLDFAKKIGVNGQKTLLLVDYQASENRFLPLAVRNLPNVKLCLPHNISVKDLLVVDAVIASGSAVKEINERYASYAS
jgi:large subunit ribosomal protein L4